jgi:hypothetical protein
MATPTTLPATFVSGNTLTAAQLNDLRGAFRVLQVINVPYATFASSTSATYTDSGMTATITPSATSSKILMIISTTAYSNSASTGMGLRLVRGTTTLRTNVGYCFSTGGSQSSDPNFNYLDSPNTTSATTYKLQFSRTDGGGTVFINPNNNEGYITLMEISA